MKRKLNQMAKNSYLYFVQLANRQEVKVSEKSPVFLLSFPSTSYYVLDKLSETFGSRLTICYTKNSYKLALEYQKRGCTIYCIDHFQTLLFKIIPILRKSKLILCDNYFAFLAEMRFSVETEIVQLWHANGAIKKFGLSAEYVKKTTNTDQERYKKVYQKTTRYVLSSTRMQGVFESNYQQPIKLLPFGYPLTDLYFNQEWLSNAKTKIEARYDLTKKIFLYVPTYRETLTTNPLNVQLLKDTVGSEWEIIVHPHPHDVRLNEELSDEDVLLKNSTSISIQELLPFVDCLLTDYSSLPFEYSLANPAGEVLFFCYDLQDYANEVGIEEDFYLKTKKQQVKTTEDLIERMNQLKRSTFLGQLNQTWNEYVDGTACKQLIEWMILNIGN